MDEYVAELRRFIEDLVSGDAHMHPPLKRRRWDRNADSGKGKWRDINEPLCGRTSMSTMWCYSP
ncbi:MAG: hypothetical protein ACLTXL_11520 [Clostridia bacterium]